MTLEELVVKITGDTSGFTKSLGKMAGATAKAIAAASTAAAAGVAALAKSAIDSYADYEQLIGGVETLFKDSAGVVEEYADNAYKTAGMSANEYMETVTGFSASLLQSLDGDTQAAAHSADMALTDMADNANKMGTSMESIKNAYQGFAKQNYTMLDNLKLGYGGTKEEMQRLLADAQEISGVEYDISNLNDVFNAIHIIQEELGITGTTAKEAASTISGSAQMMKSSWQNLLTGIADENADFEGLIENFVDSIGAFMENIMPRVEVALQGVAKLVQQLAPIIAEALPGLIDGLLPNLIDAITSIIESLLQAIPTLLPTLIEGFTQVVFQILDAIIAVAPDIVQALIDGLVMIMEALAENLPQLTQTLVDGLLQIVQTIIDNLPVFLDAFLQLLLAFNEALIQALPQIIAALPQLIQGLLDFFLGAIPQIIDAGIQLFVALVEALPDIIDQIVAVLPQIIDAITTAFTENIDKIIDCGVQLLTALVENLPAIIEAIIAVLPQLIDAIINALLDNIQLIIDCGVKLLTALVENLPEIIMTVVAAIPEIIASLVEAILEGLPKIIEAGTNLIKGLFEGIQNAASWLYDKLSGWCSSVIDWIKGFFGIHSPSTKMAEEGKYLVLGLAKGITDNTDEATNALDRMAKDMENSFNPMLEAPELETDISIDRTQLDNAVALGEFKPVVTADGIEIERQDNIQDVLNVQNENLISTLIQTSRMLIEAIEGKDLSVSIGDDVIAYSAARGNNAYIQRTGQTLFPY